MQKKPTVVTLAQKFCSKQKELLLKASNSMWKAFHCCKQGILVAWSLF